MTDMRPTNLPPIENRDLEHATHLRFCKNGDQYFHGRSFTWNKKRIRTFDSFLTELTNSLKLDRGAVRRIYTPNLGHRIDEFDKFEEGGLYVAAGQEAFRKLQYSEIESSPRRKNNKINNSYYVEPVYHSKRRASGKIKHIKSEGKIIKCWPNGDYVNEPRTILLTSWMQNDIDIIKDAITERVSSQINGPVGKLYSREGTKIQSPDQIEHGGYYIAVRIQDRLRPVRYRDQAAKGFTTSPRSKMLPPLSRSTNKSSKFSTPEHSHPPSSIGGSENNTANTYTSRHRRTQARKEEDGVFHAKPVAHKRPTERTQKVDYDKDEGGVFKAKGQNRSTRGAQEVEDSNDTEVDLPIDQREAEVVNEEKQHTTNKSNNSRAAANSRTQPPQRNNNPHNNPSTRERNDKKRPNNTNNSKNSNQNNRRKSPSPVPQDEIAETEEADEIAETEEADETAETEEVVEN